MYNFKDKNCSYRFSAEYYDKAYTTLLSLRLCGYGTGDYCGYEM